jgi:hypothetical protein
MMFGYRFTNVFLFIWLVLFSGIIGCTVKYIDKVTIFEIKGEVYDEESDLPVENAAVLFLDTGYDYVRSKNPFLVRIGHSDAEGKFTARLNYLWRTKDFVLQNPPPKTFDIVLSHEAYEPRRFQFNESDLQQGGMRFEINLDKIYLQPREDRKE